MKHTRWSKRDEMPNRMAQQEQMKWNIQNRNIMLLITLITYWQNVQRERERERTGAAACKSVIEWIQRHMRLITLSRCCHCLPKISASRVYVFVCVCMWPLLLSTHRNEPWANFSVFQLMKCWISLSTNATNIFFFRFRFYFRNIYMPIVVVIAATTAVAAVDAMC